VDDLRARLARVLWIGGGPQAGKTTLSRLLAGKWDLKVYNLDWHAVREHAGRPGTAVASFQRLSMDERWAVPSADELLERSIAIWEDGFALVVEDLLALPCSRTIVAEGPGAFPWCVAPLLRSTRQAIFLVPTRERRDLVAERRWGTGQLERFPGIVDRERALINISARDALLDARIVSSCAELGLRCERLDGSLDLDASLALLEDHFRENLPATPNV
jgi:cytidylate kinase